MRRTNHEKIVGLQPKTYSYPKDNNDEGKKAKGTKKCVIKRELKFKDYKNCQSHQRILNIINYLEGKKLM